MDIERERGITIKSPAITLPWRSRDGKEYILNLVDTPGHVDFSYEVSRAISACEGAILLIDATQGVEAQTLANMYLALEHNLTIIPVINKIDLPSADIPRVKEQIGHDLGLDPDEALLVSAKQGTGRGRAAGGHGRAHPGAPGRRRRAAAGPDLRLPLRRLPGGDHPRARLRRRAAAGGADPASGPTARSTGRTRWAVSRPACRSAPSCAPGRWATSSPGSRTIADTRVGDTVTDDGRAPASAPLPGFREVKPVVFSSIYPVDANDYEELTDGHGEAEAQRRLPGLREGLLGGPGLRLPLRLPGAAAPGDRAGAAGARVHLSIVFTAPSVQLPGHAAGTAEETSRSTTRSTSPTRRRSSTTRSPTSPPPSSPPASTWATSSPCAWRSAARRRTWPTWTSKRVELVYEMPLAEVVSISTTG